MKKSRESEKALQIVPHVKICLLEEAGIYSEVCAKSRTGWGPSSPERKDCLRSVPKRMHENSWGK